MLDLQENSFVKAWCVVAYRIIIAQAPPEFTWAWEHSTPVPRATALVLTSGSDVVKSLLDSTLWRHRKKHFFSSRYRLNRSLSRSLAR